MLLTMTLLTSCCDRTNDRTSDQPSNPPDDIEFDIATENGEPLETK